MSLDSKIEPAAINIERDITKCLTCHGFFLFYFFSLIFILKLDEPFRNEEIFIISLFSKNQIWVLGVKKFFFAVFG